MTPMPEAGVSKTSLPWRLGRVAHPWRVLVTVVVLVGLLVGAFVLGRRFQQPAWQLAQQAASPVEVWAVVESRVVDDSATFAGVVKAGTTVDVKTSALPTVAVVTRRGVAPGDRVSFGGLAAVISGDPYFLLPGPLPLYRDLVTGSRGDDVSALQQSLSKAGYSVPVTGVVGSLTIKAAQQLFKSAGFALPTTSAPPASSPTTAATAPPGQSPALQPLIPYRQLLTLPAEGTVTASVDLAAAVTADTTLVSVRTSESYVSFVADVVNADKIKVGDSVTIRLQGATTVGGKITSVGPFQTGTANGAVAGRPVVVTPDSGTANGALVVSANVTVVTQQSHDAGLAVPLTAVRQDASGSYVIARRESLSSASPGTASTVRITVERTADGWAAVSGDLTVGDAVRVSG